MSDNTGLMGRWQLLGKNPKIICDTAHNKEGLQLVLNQLKEEDYQRLHIVLGFVKDKNMESVLPLFPKNAQYYFCKPDIMRGLDVTILKEKAAIFNLKGESYPSISAAYNAAKKNASVKDLVYIGGSNFVVAEVL